MRFKKYIVVLSFIFTVMSVFSFSLAVHAEDINIIGEFNRKDFAKKRPKIDLGDSYKISSYEILGEPIGANDDIMWMKFYDSNNVLLYTSPDMLFRYLGSSHPGHKFNENISVKRVRYVEFSSRGTILDFKLFGSVNVPEISNVTHKEDVNSVDFHWNNIVDSEFKGVKILLDDKLVEVVGKDIDFYTVKGLLGNKYYNFKIYSLYGDKEVLSYEKNIKTLIDPKTIPPGPVSSLTAEATDKTVKLKWKKPKDDDLAGFKILQNGKQIAEIGLEEEFIVKNLEPLTDYNFGVISVDRDKNDSSPVNLSVKTLEEKDDEPPHVPSNVFAKPSNGALIASWDKVSDKDLAGYNVYVDDKKINSNLISSTSFTIKNLENNRKYKVQVQAVDRSGNASALSLAAYGTPDERTIPIIESKYSLQDISDGVNVMFGQFWLVLAFAVGIPLSFYIIYKLKLTVLP